MISLVFISNFMNHHQLFISDELFNNAQIKYTFIACEPINAERLSLGYEDMNISRKYIVRAYEDENKELVNQLVDSCDVMIYGSAPDCFMQRRMKLNKVTFLYSERYFKFGRYHILSPLVWMNLYQDHYRYKHKNLYFLSSGYYAYFDYANLGFYRNKSLRWGYFPEKKEYDVDELLNKKGEDPLVILWCGRFLGWKHPEKMLALAESIQDENVIFEMIGDGEQFENIQTLVQKRNMSQRFRFFRSLSPQEVRLHMEKASIYLFSSDKQEGWGAVLNEAMNSGCAVVASNEIGAVPYLVQNGVNGLIYKRGKDQQMIELVKELIMNPQKRKFLGSNAYETINKVWNPKMAASNLVQVIESLVNKNEIKLIKDGPASFIPKDEKEEKF